MELKEAIQAVIDESNNEYARVYARAASELGGSMNAVVVTSDKAPVVGIAHERTGKIMVGEELRVQLLYVLSNLQYWRGSRAKEVKAVLKKYSERR